MSTEYTIASAKLAPQTAIGGAVIFGIPLPDIVLYATLIYTLVQGYVLVRDKIYAPWKEKRNGRNRQDPGQPA